MFKTLFGIENKEVKRNCVLLPLLHRGALSLFKIKKFSRGKLYGAGNTSSANFTLIHTGACAGLVGDALLYLKETACQNVLLFGSCGLISKDVSEKSVLNADIRKFNQRESASGLRKSAFLDIGSLVSPEKCFAFESFSQMLLQKEKPADIFYADKDLLNRFLKINPAIKEAICATVSSLKLEEERQDFFVEKGIDIVEMECSSFFAAAQYSGLKAVALFYISDIIKEKLFYQNLSAADKAKLFLSLKTAAQLLNNFSAVI